MVGQKRLKRHFRTHFSNGLATFIDAKSMDFKVIDTVETGLGICTIFPEQGLGICTNFSEQGPADNQARGPEFKPQTKI